MRFYRGLYRNKSFTFDQNIHEQSAYNEKIYDSINGSIYEPVC